MDRSQIPFFRDAIEALAASFSVEFTEAMFNGYLLGLKDLSIEAIQFAVGEAIRTCTFFPKPVELRRLAGEQTYEQRAIDAWGDAIKTVSGKGKWKHIDFGDQLINATIRNLGGWSTFCERCGDEDGTKWARVDFLKTYQAFAAGGVDGEACKPLPGLSEATAVAGKLQAPIVHRIECSPERLNLPVPMRQPALEATRAVPNLFLRKVD